MEEYQRDKILSHINYLVENTNDFESVFEGLRARRIFNVFMADEILTSHSEPQNRLRYMYRYVTTRGPSAFQQLCEVLKETGNVSLAEFLSGESLYKGNRIENDMEEEYPYNKEWIVTKAIRRMDFDNTKVYKMGSRLKGLALIINIRVFVNNISEERFGSEHDINRLTSILRQLDYDVILHEDLSAKDIEEKMKEFADDEGHKKCDSAIVFVMSHGRSDYNSSLSETVNIVGYDGAVINSQMIINRLMAHNCAGLQGKPKLFFFQACRGDYYNYPVLSEIQPRKDNSQFPNDVQTDGSLQPPSNYHRSDSDIIIGYSTSPGFVSMRDPDKGGWYIQTLCRVIAKYAWKEDIVTLLEIVQSESYKENNKHPNWIINCKQISRGFNKKFYFHPGFSNLDSLVTRNGS